MTNHKNRETMRKINHKSDFTLILKLRACKGGKPCGELVEVPFPAHDWEARFWTWSKANCFTASRKGGVNRNCIDDGGNILVVFDNHGLLAGRLWVEYTEWVPDSTYPDGFQKLVTSQPLDFELVKGPACPPGELEAAIVIPQVAGGAGAPLPFVFEGCIPSDFSPDHPVAVYDRSTNAFTAIGGELPEGYNELLEDGTLQASTKAEFRCGNVVYRYTGRELVNTAIERNPNRRLVHRVPSLKAHPGLAYLDKHYLSVREIGCLGNEPRRISLKGMRFMDMDGYEFPLSDLEIRSCPEIIAHIEEDDLILEAGPNYRPCYEGPYYVRIHLPSVGSSPGGGYDNFIGVRYTASGDKIFYQVRGALSVARPAPPRTDALEVVSCKKTGEIRGFDLEINYNHCKWRVEVWRPGRVRVGSRVEVRRRIRQWRWRRPNEANNGVFHFTGRTCLIRVKRRAGRVWSEWAYFHVSPFAPAGSAFPSRQRRT